MDLIRLIKLKKINGDLDNLSEQEEYFLSFFNNLENYDNYYLTNEHEYHVMHIDLDKKLFWCSYYMIWQRVKFKFSINNKEMVDLIYSVLNKLGIHDITVDDSDANKIENLYKFLKTEEL